MEGVVTKNKVCWGILFLILFGIEAGGIYLLKQSFDDPQSKEYLSLNSALKDWNNSFASFERLKVSINSNTLSTNHTQTWNSNSKDFPKYLVNFYSGFVNFSSAENEFVMNAAPAGLEYNLTTDLILTVTDQNSSNYSQVIQNSIVYSRKRSSLNFKVCSNENKGYWDPVSGSCYHDYHTTKFCFVLDNNYSLVEWYESGCDNSAYFEQELVRWKSRESVKSVNLSIFTEIRSEKDPFVYASYNGLKEFSASSSEYRIAGITLVVFSSLLLIISFYFTCCHKRKKSYLTMHDTNKV